MFLLLFLFLPGKNKKEVVNFSSPFPFALRPSPLSSLFSLLQGAAWCTPAML